MQLQENTYFGEHGRYMLIRLLGSGGYSQVWLAKDTTAEIEVALKVYAPGKGLDDKGVELFRNEYRLVFALNHPNLLRPTFFEVFERMPYLIMPYYERGSSINLAGAINKDMAWKFLHDVAYGLAYLHEPEPPLIHQDIKPDNVLIDNENNFLIADFGISSKAQNTLRQSVSSPMAGAGTKSYMAPERFFAGYKPIKASDIWSLGASLYELMTGDPPFLEHGGSVQNEKTVISDLAGNWPAELNEIVKKCLQFHTWDRPTAKYIYELSRQFVRPGMIANREVQSSTKTEDPLEVHSHSLKNVTQHEPERIVKDDPPPPSVKPASPLLKILALTGMLIAGLCVGYVAGRFQHRPNPKLNECIQIIAQGDSIFDDNDLSTWRASLAKYMEAKEIIEKNALPLPKMDFRINHLKSDMDQVVKTSIENAQKAFSVGSEMALINLNEALQLDPDNQEAKTLLEQYTAHFNSKNK